MISSDEESFTELLKQGLKKKQNDAKKTGMKNQSNECESLLSLSSEEDESVNYRVKETAHDISSDWEDDLRQRHQKNALISDEASSTDEASSPDESLTSQSLNELTESISALKIKKTQRKDLKQTTSSPASHRRNVIESSSASCRRNVVESSDDEDAYENFLKKMRKPKTRISSTSSEGSVGGEAVSEDPDTSLDGFIVPDDESISEGSITDDESVFYLKTTNLLDKRARPSSSEVHTHLQSYEGVPLDSSEVFSHNSSGDLSLFSESGSDNNYSDIKSGEQKNSFSMQVSFDSSPDIPREVNSPDVKANKPSHRVGPLLLSDSDDESFEDLIKEGLKKRVADTPEPTRQTKRDNPSKKPEIRGLPLTPARKLRTLMESTSSKHNNSDISLPSLSDDEDDDVILVSESIQTPAPSRIRTKPLIQTRLTPSARLIKPSSQGSVTPASNRSRVLLDSIHTNFTRTEPRSRKPPSLSATGSSSHRHSSFIASLAANFDENKTRHPEAVKFISNLKKTKEELVERLFNLYNQTVFDSKLSDVKVTFNKRLLKTAGLCKYMSTRTHKTKQASVELSEKVCDSAERVRDTLIHEMCHAAVWIINETQDGHGRYWQYWARKSELEYRELPPIRRCHSYDITTKYIYKCTKCGQQVGRHSKSLDIEKKVCGRCKGRFELLTQSANGLKTPAKTPNKFALFVKDNYASVKKKRTLSHKEVMQELSSAFSQGLKISK